MAYKFRITQIAAAAMLVAGAMSFADDVVPTAVQSAIGSVTSTGYFRAGWGVAGKGGTAECFGVGYAKFRLGNECDAYAEIGLDIPVFNQSNGAQWVAHTMIQADAPYSDWGSNKTNFAQNYISVSHFGDGVLKDAVLWAGRRYYDRPDLHMLDYKYLVADGDGAGIENVGLGNSGALFSYALMRPIDTVHTNRTWLENLFKVSNVVAGPGAFTFNAGLTFGDKADDTANATTGVVTPTAAAKNGWYLSGAFDTPFANLGSNRVGLQYGRGANATGNFSQVNQNAVTDDSTLQVFENITLEPKDTNWTMLGHAIYRKDKYQVAGDDTWWAIGVRPQYHFTDIFGFATELGYEQFKPTNSSSQSISKVTFALTAAAGKGAYARPELRLFYTYAKWNDAAKAGAMNVVNADGTQGVYNGSTSGSSIGVQAEAWW